MKETLLRELFLPLRMAEKVANHHFNFEWQYEILAKGNNKKMQFMLAGVFSAVMHISSQQCYYALRNCDLIVVKKSLRSILE